MVSQAANAVMQRQGGGVIVNISSVSALRPSPGTAAYGAAKAGVDSLTRSLAVEWGPAVRVNTVDVGLCRTEQTADHYGGDDTVRAIEETIPLGRMAEPDGGRPRRGLPGLRPRAAMSPAPPWSATAAASHPLFLHVVQKEQQ